MTDKTEGLVKVYQAAAMMGVTYQAIYKLIDRGRIDVVKVGWQKFIPIQEVTDRIRYKSEREVIRIDP